MFRRSFALCLLLLPVLAAADGPNGRLYFTERNQGLLGTLQGTIETYVDAVSLGEGPIAVYGSIKTMGVVPGDYGASYDLSGNFTGDLYVNPLFSDVLDATTDGTSNYFMSLDGTVYQSALDFTGHTALFITSFYPGGISYDRTRNALWISTGNVLTAFSLTGDVLKSFAVSGENAAVAFDPLDGTIWVGSTVLTQYSADGDVLQNYVLNSGAMVTGMEFDLQPVPEPPTMAVVGLGLLAVGRRRKAIQTK